MRDKIKLVSSAGTGHYYTTTKNKRLHPDKMETKKFDPVVRKHVAYKESKIKYLGSAARAPEVETTRRGIAPALRGRRIVGVIVRDRRLRWPIAANLEAAIRHQFVRSVARRAKYILIALDGGTLIIHLGMSGSLRLLSADVPPRLHDHWDIRPRQRAGSAFSRSAPLRQPALDGIESRRASAIGQARPGAVEQAVRCGLSVSCHAPAQGRHQAIHHEFAAWSSASGTSMQARRCFARAFRRAAPQAVSAGRRRSPWRRPSKTSWPKPSASAARRFATTSMPREYPVIFGSACSSTSGPDNPAACARPRSSNSRRVSARRIGAPPASIDPAGGRLAATAV